MEIDWNDFCVFKLHQKSGIFTEHQMHILVIPSEHYVTRCVPLGSIFQYQQVHALKSTGIKVGVVSAGFVPFNMMLSKYPCVVYENDDGVNTYRCYKKLFIPGRIAEKVFWKYLVRNYLQLFKKYITDHGQPDIVHAHNCFFAGTVALEIKRKFAIPYLITEHSSAFARRLVSSQQVNLAKEVLKNADVITVVSSSHGGTLEKICGSDAQPYYAIFNMLDDRFEGEKLVRNIKNNDGRMFTFLSIGTLDHNKNHTDLLQAFATKFKGDCEMKLKIGGDGPLRKQLQLQINRLGLTDQVVLLGMLSRDKVLREMQNCDVFVLPSIFETFGVVLIEAQALGKPVVATKCGGPEDIVNPYNGLLIPTKDIAALADAMSNIYFNIDKYNASLIRKDCISRFGKDAFLKRLINIYTGIHKEGKRK